MVQKLALAILLSLVSAGLIAQAPAWGIEDVSTYVLTAWDMDPATSTVDVSNLPNFHRFATSSGVFVGAVHLPDGALIVSMALEACDTADDGGSFANLLRFAISGGSTGLGGVSTGDAATPGCGSTSEDLASPETVQNELYRYLVRAGNDTLDGQTTIGAVRIRYRLQVSPPPADPSFGDVPTGDAAFQFIEALAASGITAGCGGGNYCPDGFVTRRQMAVFLAKALGLHWPGGPLF
jgi:hypothetical protein